MRSRALFVLALLLATSFGNTSRAQDDATKNAARELAQQGMDAATRGDHKTALDLYRRAYSLVPAPTLAVREARSLVTLGRWVEAMEAYVRATRTRLGPDATAAFRDAVRQAEDELAALRPRLPRLEIQLEGIERNHPALSVRVDGTPWPAARLGVSSPIDPGRHEVVAEIKGHRALERVSIAEGESKSIQLTLPAQTDAPVDAARAPEVTREQSAGKPDRTLAFVSFGVGGAGLLVGVVSGVMATQKHSSAEDSCPGGKCREGSSGADDVDAFHRFRTISSVGYVVGAVGVGAGVTLWLTAKPNDRRVGAFVGPTRAGLLGRF